MARPTKLTQELLAKAKTYIDTCIDRPVYTEKGALSYVDVNLPSKVGLALFLDIDKTTVDQWCKVSVSEEIFNDKLEGSQRTMDYSFAQEFSSIVETVMQEQEKRLVNNGLGGLYQQKTNGMLLSKHGYAEKTETDLTSKGKAIGTSTLTPEIIAEADRLLKEKKLNG